MTKPSSIVVLSFLSTKAVRPVGLYARESPSCRQSEVFTRAGANQPITVKKVLATKVRFLRIPASWVSGAGSLRTKVSWLRNRCSWLLSHACQGFPEVYGPAKVSWLRTQSGWFLMTLGQVAKVRFLRNTYPVTHCMFAIYNKVSLTY
jgi:hypothetical protein